MKQLVLGCLLLAVCGAADWNAELQQFEPSFRLPRQPDATACGTTFSKEIFQIHIPQRENSQLYECEFRVIPFTDDICRLRIDFKKFQLPSSTSCSGEFLQVGPRRLCGSISGAQLVRISNSSLTITYRGLSKEEILVEVQQERCKQPQAPPSCDVITSDLQTELFSPNYPDPFPTPVSCRYTLLPLPEMCKAQLKFVEFDLPDSPDCLKARLQISGKPYCGSKSGWTVEENLNGSFVFEFSAISNDFQGNFRILVKQIPCLNNVVTTNSSANQIANYQQNSVCPVCCNRVFNSPSFVIHTPGFLSPGASTNFHCSYRLAQASPSSCRLRFNFVHFWLGQEDVYYGCTDSFLEIDGRRWCGCKDGISVVTYFESSIKEIYLNIRGPSSRGFVIEVFQEECGPRGRSVPQVLNEDPNKQVEVFFNSTERKSRFLISNDEGRCQQWHVPQFFDKVRGILESIIDKCPSPPSDTIPPNVPPLYPLYPTFPPSNPIFPPTYPQNPILPPNYPQSPGFPSPIPPNPPQNPIFPPTYPQNPILPPNYPQNPGFPSPIPPNPPQNPIFPPTQPQNPISPPTFPFPPPNCPPSPQPPILPPSPPVQPQQCRILTSLEGTIQSPGYPWEYPPNQKCCYRIRQAAGFCKVQLTVLDFDLVWSPKCWKDYLLLDKTTRYCGRSLQSSFAAVPFRNGLASIDFITDSFLSGRGFKAIFFQIPCYLPRSDGPSATQPDDNNIFLDEFPVRYSLKKKLHLPEKS